MNNIMNAANSAGEDFLEKYTLIILNYIIKKRLN
jgi:hypothetical protein